MKQFFIALPFVCLVFSALGGPKSNVDKDGIGIQGYDPVAFFTDGKPVLGKEGFYATYNGVTYRFASAEHQAIFEKDPAKYEPQFGGYCAFGVANGHTAPVNVEAFQIVDGRLIMQHDTKVRDAFNKDQKGNLEAADKNWSASCAGSK